MFRLSFAVTFIFIFLSSTIQASVSKYILEGTIVTMVDEDEYFQGALLIEDGYIKKIIREDELFEEDITEIPVIHTQGLIYPGLMNIHNHTAYNFLPLWTVPKRYDNRYQWSAHSTYATDIKYPKKLIHASKYYNLAIEACKYAEIKALVGGETAIQGTPNLKGVKDILIRNVESKNFGVDKVYQYVQPISGNLLDHEKLLRYSTEDKLDAWFVHLAEGVDQKSNDEFTILKEKGLLKPWLVVIHGTGLNKEQLEEMGEIGAKLVWSPVSNLLLYGDTTRVDYAIQSGVTVSLGTDWSPSGSKQLLQEMKYAWEINKAREDLPDYEPFNTYELVKMVTVNPAYTVGWTNKVGQIKEGMVADLAIFSIPSNSVYIPELSVDNPYDALVLASTKDVKLVIINGHAKYGKSSYMRLLNGSDMEIISSEIIRDRAIDVTEDNVKKGTQKFSDILTSLKEALKFDREYMRTKFLISEADKQDSSSFDLWLDKTFPKGITPLKLTPIFIQNDKDFFQSIEKVRHANLKYDIKHKYYPKINSVLQFINASTTTFKLLDDEVKLNSRSASAIIDYRDGEDNILGNEDDIIIDSLKELDEIKYIGPKSIKKIESYVTSPKSLENENMILLNYLNSNLLTFKILDVDMGLRKDAAQSIFNFRAGEDNIIGTIDDNLFFFIKDILDLSRVGNASLKKIKKYTNINGL